jgi:catechol 2,3-dioxygenase-like lactoylglutathione lyase family enzyme
VDDHEIRFRTGHVGINVSDLERSVTFYRELFGFETLERSDEPRRRFALLGQGDDLILTLWEQARGRFLTDRPGLHHLSFRVDTLGEVGAVERRAKARGARIYHGGIVAHREGASSGGLFFEDPDGVRLEVFTPRGAGSSPAPTGEAPTCGFF